MDGEDELNAMEVQFFCCSVGEKFLQID